MKRLLIIGASIMQLPAIQKAKEMGLYVGTVDFDPNAIGIPYSDEYFNISTIDEENVYKTAKAFKADGVMTLATDRPMRSVAYATWKLGLSGISYDVAIKATDKGEMIKAFENAGVEHPWYFIASNLDTLQDIEDKITYPCICKPVDNAGSRGVVLVENKDELKKSFLYSSSNGLSGTVIIEEYLQGCEVSAEVIAIDREIHVLQITDKLTTGAPHFVEIGHSQPSRIKGENLGLIRSLAERAVRAIGIDNGTAHVEIMLTENGPKMIELGARLGGDCIATHLVPLSTGIDMIKAAIEISLGKKPNITPLFSKGAAIRYFFNERHGVIKNVDGIELAKKTRGVCEVTFMKKVGDEVGKLRNSLDRIGYIIAQSDNAVSAMQICNDAIENINITVR